MIRNLLFALCCLTLVISCKKKVKDQLPAVVTVSVSEVTASTAKVVINVTDEGSSSVTGAGVCWGTSSNPGLSNNTSNIGMGKGIFTAVITGLASQTLYHVRAFATNSSGTSFGVDLSFTTTN